MAEANTEDSLVQGRQSLQQSDQSADPRIVAVSVVAATGDHKSVVVVDLIVGRKLAGSHTETIPGLAFFAQHSDEHSEISSVLDFNVFGIFCAKKQRKSLHPHPPQWILIFSPSRGDRMRRTFLSLSKLRFQFRERKSGEGKERWVYC